MPWFWKVFGYVVSVGSWQIFAPTLFINVFVIEEGILAKVINYPFQIGSNNSGPPYLEARRAMVPVTAFGPDFPSIDQ